MSHLCVTHCFDGSVSEYHAWRLAVMATANVEPMTGDAMQVWGNWIKPPQDALQILLTHADWGGVIFPREALLLHVRLAKLAGRVPGGWRRLTADFAMGLHDACLDDIPIRYEVDYSTQLMYQMSGR